MPGGLNYVCCRDLSGSILLQKCDNFCNNVEFFVQKWNNAKYLLQIIPPHTFPNSLFTKSNLWEDIVRVQFLSIFTSTNLSLNRSQLVFPKSTFFESNFARRNANNISLSLFIRALFVSLPLNVVPLIFYWC